MTEIEVTNLFFSYTESVEVLKGISLNLTEESTAIVGQNGAGKSTLVKLIKGLIKPTSGTITLNGNNIKGLTAADLARHIGMVFQNPNDQIFKNNVINEVMFGPLNIGQTKDEAYAKSMIALEKVGLSHQVNQNPYDLSLSERKMVSIASVLAMDTEVVIFDEPTMGQDFDGKQILKSIIAELQNNGKLVLCILHDMDFAAAVFEKTLILNQGCVILEGPTREVFTSKEILKKAYLDQPSLMLIAEQFGIVDRYLTEDELVGRLKEI